MTPFQLLLGIVSAVLFYLFFKQLFSGTHPKRGLDFEAKVADEQVGGILRPDKIFSKLPESSSRVEDLLVHADCAVNDEDFTEAKKALGSALILEPQNRDILYKMAYVSMQTGEPNSAREHLESLLELEPTDDMAHAMLANILHQEGEDTEALVHHAKAISLDGSYAPHYYNYANTLHDLKRDAEALDAYKKAYTLDPSLKAAKEMIEIIEEK